MNATYRLQLTPAFGFAEARRLIPYFRRLGISHLYLSPITDARMGSVHGYDVVDHNRVRDEIGGEAGFEALREACVEAGLGLVLDFVPNHAAVGPRNAYWQDVLAYGPSSLYGYYFDIDWAPLKRELHNKLLLPFLGSQYGEALDAGEIRLGCEDGRLYAVYYDQRFALRPESYAEVLEAALPRLERTDLYWDVLELLNAYRTVNAAERERAEALGERFAELVARAPLDATLEEYQGERLHELLERQFWRLSSWKTAGYEINYRRFFDINHLVALRMEESEVFFDAHRLLGRLMRREGVEGVRLDHVDGLNDPGGYLRRVRELGPRHIWVEKILAAGEVIPPDWPVDGTTGYEFLNDVVRVLNWPGGEARLDVLYRRSVPEARPYADVVHDSKLLVMATSLAGELFRLAYGLNYLSEADYHTRDFTLEALREALAEVIAVFPRYRTYLPEHHDDASELVATVVHEASRRNPAFEPTVFAFIQRVLLGPLLPELEEGRLAWVSRFQQYTAPVAAKGVEDTAFFRYHRLVALNNVGGEPGRFAYPPEIFHAHARFKAMRYPLNLLATATHDHKRGEDVRMRLIVLSELNDAWRAVLRSLSRLSRRFVVQRGPAASDMYQYYQALLALYDSDEPERLEDRLDAYMQKASREAKQYTTWMNPDEEYEAALSRFVRGMLRDRRVARAIAPLSEAMARYGLANSLSQLIIKICSPGVPDFYQGSELLDLSLVDPDNRRPVDYRRRAHLLDELEPLLQEPDPKTLAAWLSATDPRLKMYVMVRLLRFRHDHPAVFAGGHQALDVSGESREHVLAFAREAEGQAIVAVVPRFPALLAMREGWGDTEVALPHGGDWHELLSGARVAKTQRLRLAELPLLWAVLSSR